MVLFGAVGVGVLALGLASMRKGHEDLGHPNPHIKESNKRHMILIGLDACVFFEVVWDERCFRVSTKIRSRHGP